MDFYSSSAVQWTPPRDRLPSTEGISDSPDQPVHVPQLLLDDLASRECQHQNIPPWPVAIQWTDLAATHSFMGWKDTTLPGEYTGVPELEDQVSLPLKLFNDFVFESNHAPGIWDWSFADTDTPDIISTPQKSLTDFMVPEYIITTKGNNHWVDSEAFAPCTVVKHGHLAAGSEMTCQECEAQFTTKASLRLHTHETQHAPYRCLCEATFTRLDVLDRHIQVSNSETVFTCPYCQTKPKSFGRQDHLTQHLRGFHNMDLVGGVGEDTSLRPSRRPKKRLLCTHEDCMDMENEGTVPSPSGPRRPSFQSQKQLTSHLREVHDECPFPCKAAGCARKGRKGFFRNRDLLKHSKDHHSRSYP